jgi:hypothetical protein
MAIISFQGERTSSNKNLANIGVDSIAALFQERNEEETHFSFLSFSAVCQE